MILKGNKRGGARDLARHLFKPENEHVEVHEIRGFVSDNVADALIEAYAVSRGTKCRKFLFSLALNPPETENVPIEAFERAIVDVERKLGLTDQPRIVVFHEKEGRRHAHCVWSRINIQTMTAIDQPHFKLKLGDISRKLYLEYGWKLPEGLIDPSLRNPLTFDRKEWFLAKRAGRDPRDIKAALRQCWAASDSGKAFRQALEQRGYYLAQGNRRAVVAIDMHGGIYAVARWAGVKTKDVLDRVHDIGTLPSLQEAQNDLANRMCQKLSSFVASAREDFARAAGMLESRRLAMVEEHRAARRQLLTQQDERQIAESRQRAERFRKGLAGLWDRVTGRHARLRLENEEEARAFAMRDAKERQTLVATQLQERQRLQDEIRQERRLHVREMTWLHRQTASLRPRDRPAVRNSSAEPKRRRRQDAGPSR